jgi:hypothetical protein
VIAAVIVLIPVVSQVHKNQERQEGVEAARYDIRFWKSSNQWNDRYDFSDKALGQDAEVAVTRATNARIQAHESAPVGLEFRAAYLAYLRDARNREMPRYAAQAAAAQEASQTLYYKEGYLAGNAFAASWNGKMNEQYCAAMGFNSEHNLYLAMHQSMEGLEYAQGWKAGVAHYYNH